MSEPVNPKQAMPADPMSTMTEGLLPYHVMYEGAIEAGFTSAQAMQLVTASWIDTLHYHRHIQGCAE